MAIPDDTPRLDIPQGKKRIPNKTQQALTEQGLGWCSSCHAVKPLTDFRRNKNRLNGARGSCRECEAIRDRQRERTEARRQWMQEWKRTKRRMNSNKQKPIVRGIYILHMNGVYKIGKSIDVHFRVANLRASLPYPTQHLHTIPVNGDLSAAESTFHVRLHHRRLNGEWFALAANELAELLAVAEM